MNLRMRRIAQSGAGEAQPLEFLSPYGCSKGSADQYVLDYAHSYGIPATCFSDELHLRTPTSWVRKIRAGSRISCGKL